MTHLPVRGVRFLLDGRTGRPVKGARFLSKDFSSLEELSQVLPLLGKTPQGPANEDASGLVASFPRSMAGRALHAFLLVGVRFR